MIKYGIDWNKENATDGGFLDRQIVEAYLSIDERANGSTGNSAVSGSYIEFDKNTDTYYLVIQAGPARRWSKSILNIIVESDILDERIEETIELPRIIDATVGRVKIVIPTNIDTVKSFYDVDIKYKDSKKEEYKKYSIGNDLNSIYLTSGYGDIIFDKDKMLIEYGFCDYTYGGRWKRIEGIVPYKNEDGIWTSDVVKNPEKYLESHLDWYYSDERMVDYIEERGLLPQYKIDAIRAANYEDIFSMEYKMKHYGFVFLIIFFALIVAIVMRKIIKRKQKDMI